MVMVKESEEKLWLNKFIARSGVCSRRKAADLIKNGEITVNGTIQTNPSYEVQPDDKVVYNGRELHIEEQKVYVLLNKPKNMVTTLKDEAGRPTVMDIVAKRVKERVFPVGRLDRNTTGLLLLTNDGALAEKLSHPSYNVKKVYHVILDKPLDEKHLIQIREGITLEDGPVKVDGIDYVKGAEKNEVGVEIHIGRNRIVRRIFEHFGYQVLRLDRTYYAGLTKKDLKRGWCRYLTEKEILMLKHFT